MSTEIWVAIIVAITAVSGNIFIYWRSAKKEEITDFKETIREFKVEITALKQVIIELKDCIFHLEGEKEDLQDWAAALVRQMQGSTGGNRGDNPLSPPASIRRPRRPRERPE